MSEQHFFRTPFALEGDQQLIPEALQPTGVVSFQTGYGFDYERDPSSDPNAKDIERSKMNWLFGAITSVLRQYQTYGAFPYIMPEQNNGTAFAYEKGARCAYGEEHAVSVYESLVNNNTAPPTDATKWQRVSVEDLVTKTRKINVTGNLTGGGDLSNDVTLGVNVPASVPPSRTITVSAPLTGGGSLAANRSIGINATAAPTANNVILRDPNGRAQVAAPAAAADIARKADVDAVAAVANAAAPAARTITVSAPLTGGGSLAANRSIGINATAAPTANNVILRDAAGRAQVAAPSAAADIARKADVDAVAARTITVSAPLTGGGNLTANRTIGINATAAPTANNVILRDANGRAQVAAPSAAADIARKADVDAVLKKILPRYELCDFYCFRHPTLKPGFQPAQGGLITGADVKWPVAYAYLQTAEGKKLCKTEAEWKAMSKAVWATLVDGTKIGWNGIGGVPWYVIDTAAKTIRLPDLRGMYMEAAGFDSLGVGGVHGDGTREVNATTYVIQFVREPTAAFGAFGLDGPHTWGDITVNNVGVGQAGFTLNFSSGRVAPISAKNQPRAWGSLACVCLDPSAS